MDKNLAGYCGLYCGGCDILRLYREGKESNRPADWNDLPARFREKLPIRPLPIVCHGCQSDTVFGGCSKCPMRACARKRGNVSLCTECEKYPCLRTRLYNLVAWLFSFEKKLPHIKTKAPNLERIRCIGLDSWLAEQEKQWSCPECGTPFSWYRTTCAKCGRDLESLKGFSTAEANQANARR